MNLSDLTLYMAPMAGYTDLPFRLLTQKYGADVTTSEMISAKGLYYKDKKTDALLKSIPEERKFGIQIFGSDPDIFRQVIPELELKRKNGELNYKFIDFNVGCPAPKVVKNGDGSAVLKDLNKLGDCIEALKSSSSVPVSVKTRLGFNINNGLEIAKVIEESGADRIIIHPRTREEFYSGHSDWNSAREILERSKIPVVLSGDINNPEEAQKAFELGFNHLMIGRAAVNNPTIFNQIKDYLIYGCYNSFTPKNRIDIAIEHINLALRFDKSDHMIIALRKQLASYIKGLPKASQLRSKLFTITDKDEVLSMLNDMRNENENFSHNS